MKEAGDEDLTTVMPRNVLSFALREPARRETVDEVRRETPVPSSARRPIQAPAPAPEPAFPQARARPPLDAFGEPPPKSKAVPRPATAVTPTTRVPRRRSGVSAIAAALGTFTLVFLFGILVGRLYEPRRAPVQAANVVEPAAVAAPLVADPAPVAVEAAPSPVAMMSQPIVDHSAPEPPVSAPSPTSAPAPEPVKKVVKPRATRHVAVVPQYRSAAVATMSKHPIKHAASPPASVAADPVTPPPAAPQNEDDMTAAAAADDLARAQLEATFK